MYLYTEQEECHFFLSPVGLFRYTYHDLYTFTYKNNKKMCVVSLVAK